MLQRFSLFCPRHAIFVMLRANALIQHLHFLISRHTYLLRTATIAVTDDERKFQKTL